jgi:L-iditol 2-dehydrogenase
MPQNTPLIDSYEIFLSWAQRSCHPASLQQYSSKISAFYDDNRYFCFTRFKIQWLFCRERFLLHEYSTKAFQGPIMKAVQLTGIRSLTISDVSTPYISQTDDVLIRMNCVGICGSDVHYYCEGRIGNQVVEYPFTIGHEGAGTVVGTGSGVTRVRVGDRIAIDPAVFCGTCDQCVAKRENTCRNLLFLGCPEQLSGCLSEFLVMPERCCFPIPQTMSFEQASLSEPLAIGLYAVEQAAPSPNAAVAILGMGPIGLSVNHALFARGITKIYSTDILDYRIAFAKTLRPLYCGHAVTDNIVKEVSKREPLLCDTVFECCGKKEAILQGIELLKPGGTLTIIGIPEVDDIAFPLHALRRKEITIKNIRRQNLCTQKAITALGDKSIRMDFLVTHHFALHQAKEAFDLVADHRDGVIKAMITF